jgi:hypothetical protein
MPGACTHVTSTFPIRWEQRARVPAARQLSDVYPGRLGRGSAESVAKVWDDPWGRACQLAVRARPFAAQ